MTVTWQFHPLSVLLVLSALLSMGVANYAWRRRDTPGSPYLAAVMGCSTLWSLGHGLRLVSGTLDLKLLWLEAFSGLAAGFIPVCWLAFTLAYTGQAERLTRRLLFVVSIPGCVMFLLGLTNPLHGLVWQATIETSGEYAMLSRTLQPAYFGYVLYAYALFLAGTVVLVRQVLRTNQVFRTQGSLVLIAAAVPFLGNVTWVLGVTGASVNLTPVGFSVSGAALALAISRFGLLDLTPLARDAVVERMRDGYLVVDEQARVLDANPAGRRLLGIDGDVVGRAVREAVPQLLGPLETDGQSGDDAATERVADGTPSDVAIVDGPDGRLVEVDVSPLDFSGFTGRLVLLRDVTERRRNLLALRRANRRLERFAGVVSHDLRNPLNVAAGHCELARSTGDLEHAEKTAAALSRMETLIDDVLTLARTGDAVDAEDTVSLASLSHRAWMQVATDRASLVVVDDCSFTADADHLQRVLENLFRNSVEHGSTSSRPEADDSVEHGSTTHRSQTHGASVEHGDHAVTVRVGPTTDGFWVEDDGPGIDPDRRQAVFEFGETTHTEGTGLGLAIVREIVEAHGWQIVVTEGASGGARFEVSGVALTSTAGDDVETSPPPGSTAASE